MQQIFREEAAAAALVTPANTVQGSVVWGEQAESEYGVVYQEVDELNEILAEHQAEQIANLADTAPSSIADPQGLIDQYLAIVTEFEERLVSEGIVPGEERLRSDPQTHATAYEVVDWEGYEALVIEVLERYQSQ